MQPPGKPVSFTATAVTTPAKGINLVWQVPYIPAHGITCFGSLAVPTACPNILGVSAAFGGSALNYYTVEWWTTSAFPGTNTKTTQGNTITLLAADGLVGGTTYFFRVQALNLNNFVSAFCQRGDNSPYLCPDNLLLPSGAYSTGAYVTATMPP
ncbi:Aste57867_19612 [Aphanomyces stellatus]|uniref:Aste57867_19612 protein n=1 Tax=Aphanomyces stellatus TaxID=120398 RepID=A0A485LDH6_9STRA|nr:hypothetical protein As57867_019548 [Aphanomyces stellatus]VFT96313.1 Aste57867_19612 [Aphanomyces stellatus]